MIIPETGFAGSRQLLGEEKEEASASLDVQKRRILAATAVIKSNFPARFHFQILRTCRSGPFYW
jgi:hypothetical protein